MLNHHGIFVNELASRKVAILRNRYSNEAHHKKISDVVFWLPLPDGISVLSLNTGKRAM